MIDIDGKDLQEPRFSSGGDCVGSVVRGGPCMSAIRETTVRKFVYDPFVGVLLRAHKDQTLETPRQVRSHACSTCTHCSRVCGQPVSLKTGYCKARMKLRRQNLRTLCGHHKITIHDGSYWGDGRKKKGDTRLSRIAHRRNPSEPH